MTGRTTRRTITCAIGGFALLFTASIAAAQAPTPVRVRGTIDSLNGQTLAVKSRDGSTLDIKVADNTPVRAVVKASLADIKPNTFVGCTSMPQPDGSQKAVEIHIFPEAMRGTGEGSRAWDLTPNSSMTNGAVGDQVVVSDGQKLVLKYKDGEKTVMVTPETAIVTYGPATLATDAKPGTKVFIIANKQPDGTLSAGSITVGRDGVNPPM